ncbi:MAG: DUF493 family protein [Spirochaetia bacterium]|nr:DUF493 family protein [Spirochaetia bacterium]
MDEQQAPQTSAEVLQYPVEFELRVIYSLAEGAQLSKALGELLVAHGVALETVRNLPGTSAKYGRLACRVRFEDKASLYATYEAIGALPGVKTVL